MRGRRKVLFLSFDVEPDAPPYLNGLRGVDESLPGILDVLDELRVKATFFVVGRVALERQRIVKEIVDRGHEIGGHGYNHERLDRLTPSEAEAAIEKSISILRRFYDVTSFRAPNLKLPRYLLGALRARGVKVDSSLALYKPPFAREPACQDGVLRVPVTVTSSVLRSPVPAGLLASLTRLRYVTLFLHPWEFVRVRHWRPDIWLWTGPGLYLKLKSLVKAYTAKGFDIATIGSATRAVMDCGYGQA
ncbi:MAG: polysaccharide deacetylase family protein [Acidilobus sp.]